MSEKLVCDRCGVTYTDDESIRSAKREFDGWKALCERDGITPRGICPCPIIPCPGELILKGEVGKPKCPECGKLGVEMVETPNYWLCPRCRYKIPKETAERR